MYLIFTLQEVYHAAKQCSDSDCRGDAVIGRPSSHVHRWPIHLGHKFRYMYAKVYSWDKLIVLYGFCGVTQFGLIQLYNYYNMGIHSILASFLYNSWLKATIVFLSLGTNTAVLPLYMTEIPPVSLRGAVGLCHQLGITGAILLSQILGLSYVRTLS